MKPAGRRQWEPAQGSWFAFEKWKAPKFLLWSSHDPTGKLKVTELCAFNRWLYGPRRVLSQRSEERAWTTALDLENVQSPVSNLLWCDSLHFSVETFYFSSMTRGFQLFSGISEPRKTRKPFRSRVRWRTSEGLSRKLRYLWLDSFRFTSRGFAVRINENEEAHIMSNHK